MRLRTALLLAGLGLLWAVARVVPALPVVYADQTVNLLDGDSYFHLRHARAVLDHPWRLERQDALTNYPRGQRGLNQGLYDLGLAAAATLVGRPGARGPVEGEFPARLAEVLAWAPVVLGVVALWLVALAAAPLLAPERGWWPALLMLAFPGALRFYGSFGHGDHHVLEVCLFLATAWSLRLAFSGSGLRRPGGWLVGLPLALYLLSWAGAPMVVATLALALALTVSLQVRQQDWEQAHRTARVGPRLALASGAWVALAGLLVPALRGPFWLVGWAALLGLALLPPGLMAVWEAGRGGRYLPAAGLLMVILVLTQTGPVRRAVGLMLDGTVAAIAENQAGLALFLQAYAVTGLLALVGGPWALWHSRRVRQPARTAMLAFLLAWLGLHFLYRDFQYLLPALVALLSAHLLGLSGRPGPVWALCLVPVLWIHPWTDSEHILALRVVTPARRQALEWLRTHSDPEPFERSPNLVWSGRDLNYPAGSYGVLCAWDLGSLVAMLAERPVVASQSVARPWVDWLLQTSEGAAVRALGLGGPEPVRYVVLDAQMLAGAYQTAADLTGADRLRTDPLTGLMTYRNDDILSRLFLLDGDNSGHFRLVYQSPQACLLTYWATPQAVPGRYSVRRVAVGFGRVNAQQLKVWQDNPQEGWYDIRVVPEVKILEAVRGAGLVGQAPPGCVVAAELELRQRTGGTSLRYRPHTRSDAAGRFRLDLAYPTRADSQSEFLPSGPYRVFVGDRAYRLEVSLEEVRSGAELPLERRAVGCPSELAAGANLFEDPPQVVAR